MYRGIEIGHQNSTSSKPKQFTELLSKIITICDRCFLHAHFVNRGTGIKSPLDG